MKFFICLFLSLISLSSFANIESYYPTNTNRIEVSGYLNANQDSEIYLKGSPAFFFLHENVFYKDVDKTPNDFDLTVLDASQLENGILFLSLSYLEVVNINFINMADDTNEIHIQLRDVYNNPYSDNMDNYNKETLTLNINGLKSKKLSLYADRNLLVNFHQTKIHDTTIAVPENVIINDTTVMDDFTLIKKGWGAKD